MSELEKMTQEQLDTVLELHQKWLDGKPGGEQANLVGKDLRGAKFAGAELYGANLNGSILDGADFTKAILAGADLRGARFKGAILAGADLYGANLYGVDMSSVTNLTQEQLKTAKIDNNTKFPPGLTRTPDHKIEEGKENRRSLQNKGIPKDR